MSERNGNAAGANGATGSGCAISRRGMTSSSTVRVRMARRRSSPCRAGCSRTDWRRAAPSASASVQQS